jgi:hypothetical protein
MKSLGRARDARGDFLVGQRLERSKRFAGGGIDRGDCHHDLLTRASRTAWRNSYRISERMASLN